MNETRIIPAITCCIVGGMPYKGKNTPQWACKTNIRPIIIICLMGVELGAAPSPPPTPRTPWVSPRAPA